MLVLLWEVAVQPTSLGGLVRCGESRVFEAEFERTSVSNVVVFVSSFRLHAANGFLKETAAVVKGGWHKVRSPVARWNRLLKAKIEASV